jgi:hypothetical protein
VENDMIIAKSAEQLAREDLIRQTLEAAARRLECLTGNPTYQQAWRIAARSIRSMPLGEY